MGQSYNRAMLVLTVWLTLMGAGGICYPRRPRASGILFVAAGAFMLLVWAAGAIGGAPPIVAVTSAALGFGQLWKFRDASARAAHLVDWTRKA